MCSVGHTLSTCFTSSLQTILAPKQFCKSYPVRKQQETNVRARSSNAFEFRRRWFGRRPLKNTFPDISLASPRSGGR